MSALNVSAPVYVPMHKRSPSATALVYTRDELLALAPSTSESPSSSPTSDLEHTYAHPQPHQGWHALNTAMRSYLRLACPEIVMNRKMRKAVEFAQFQYRSSVNTKSPTRRSASREGGRSASPASKKHKGDQRASSPTVAAQEHDEAPAPTTTTARPTAPSKQGKRPSTRRTPSTRATRTTTRAAGSRARYNSFATFHRQLAGHAAGSADDCWRKQPVVDAVC